MSNLHVSWPDEDSDIERAFWDWLIERGYHVEVTLQRLGHRAVRVESLERDDNGFLELTFTLLDDDWEVPDPAECLVVPLTDVTAISIP